MIIIAYIDESGTHDSPVTLMSCVAGTDSQWQKFDPRFRALLKRDGLTYFHATEMKHSKNEFKGWRNDKKIRFLTDAATLTERHSMFGITTVLRDADYKSHYLSGRRPRGVQLDSSYGLCFRFTVLRAVDIIRDHHGDRVDIDLHFVIESGHKNYGDCERIFLLMKKERTPGAMILQTLRPGDKKNFPGLQVADAGAYHTFREERGRKKPPGIIRIPAPESDKPTRCYATWMHYNFIISAEKIAELKSQAGERAKLRQPSAHR